MTDSAGQLPPNDSRPPVDSSADSDAGEETGTVTHGDCEGVVVESAVRRIGHLPPGHGPDFTRIIMDLEYVDDRVWMAGEGGILVVDPEDPENMSYAGWYQDEERGVTRFHSLAVTAGGTIVAISRNAGIWFLREQAGHPGGIAAEFVLESPNRSGAVAFFELVYILTYDGSIEVWDLTNPSLPNQLDTVTGLTAPWEIVHDGEWAYVADNVLGLVPVELTDPAAPILHAPVPSEGAPQDLAVANGFAYVASGSTGIEIFDLSAPGSPVRIGAVNAPGAVVGVAVGEDLLWGVTHEETLAWDLRDPSAPSPFGLSSNTQFGLDLIATENRAFVGDWGYLAWLEHDVSIERAAAHISPATLSFYENATARTVTVSNYGSTELTVTDAWIAEDGFSLTPGQSTLAPAESTAYTVNWDDTLPAEGTLCLKTDGTGAAVRAISLVGDLETETSISLGEEAPDFLLRDVDERSWQLSAQLGQPVLLLYFATW